MGAGGYLGGEEFIGYEDKMGISQENVRVTFCLRTTKLCGATLAVLLVIGRVKKNHGPSVEAEKMLQVLCSGCDRMGNPM
jgi:hypothetical protein